MKQVIFTLTSARSGTLFLRDLFRKNVLDCDTRHETFFDWGNPTLLGPAIYHAQAGRLDVLRKLLAKKRDYISRLPGSTYLESSHAFLKSAYRVALEFFPQMQLIHLIRDPLKVSKSEAYRENWRRRVHAPFHYYLGDDGQRHFYWSLTGKEAIFEHFDFAKLSLFQRYLIQWIEIENRAIDFLNTHELHSRCFTLQVPADLNNPSVIQNLFDFLGLRLARTALSMGRRRNKSLCRTTVIERADEEACQQVLEAMPPRYLEIFQSEPYVSQPWSAKFCAGRLPAEIKTPSPLSVSERFRERVARVESA